MRLVIDASRALSGGGIEQLRHMALHFDAQSCKKRPLVLCSVHQGHLFDRKRFWVIKFRNKYSSAVFQAFILPIICVMIRATLINLDASSVNVYPALITISRDAQSFNPKIIKMYPRFSYLRFRLILIKYLQILQLRRSKFSIFLTQGHKSLLSKYLIQSKTKKLIIPHGVEIEEGMDGKYRFIEVKDCLNMVYVSNFAPYKRHDIVAQALISLAKTGAKFTMHFVGDDSNHLVRAQILRLLQSLPDDYDFFIHGHRDRNYIKNLLNSCDLAIFASECETFSNILREKVASGIPIICSDVEPMFEVAGEFATYYDVNSAASLVDRIHEFLLEYQHKRVSVNLKDRYVFLKNDQWKDCVDKYNQLLKLNAPNLFHKKSSDLS